MKAWQIGIIAGGVLIAAVLGVAFFLTSESTSAAASVNGVDIPESKVEQQLSVIKQQQPQLFEGEGGKEQEERYREQIITFLINAELIKQEADRVDIKVTEKEIDKRFDQVKDLFPEKSQFEQALKDQDLTEDGLRAQISDQLVADKMMERVTKDIKVSTKDKKEYFKENKEQFIEPEQRLWSQITADNEKEADKVLKELEDGADFAKTAKAESTDKQTAAEGGDIGWAGPNDFPPEIGEKLNNLEVGDISEVIDGGDGRFMIFKLRDFKEGKQQSFKDVEEQVAEMLETNEQQAVFSDLIDRLNKDAKIDKG